LTKQTHLVGQAGCRLACRVPEEGLHLQVGSQIGGAEHGGRVEAGPLPHARRHGRAQPGEAGHRLRQTLAGQRRRIRRPAAGEELQLVPHPGRVVGGLAVLERALVHPLQALDEADQLRPQPGVLGRLPRRAVVERGDLLVEPAPIVAGQVIENQRLLHLAGDLVGRLDARSRPAVTEAFTHGGGEVLVRRRALADAARDQGLDQRPSTLAAGCRVALQQERRPFEDDTPQRDSIPARVLARPGPGPACFRLAPELRMRVESVLQAGRVQSLEPHPRQQHVFAVGVLQLRHGRLQPARHPDVVDERRRHPIELGLGRARLLAPPGLALRFVLLQDRAPDQLGDRDHAALHLRSSERAGGDDPRGQQRVPRDRP
jgi:hypothetical protein